MPKRMVDGDRLWTSDKLRSVEPESLRMHYANLIPLALANGSFECNTERVYRDVYYYLMPSSSVSDVSRYLDEFERARLLFRWRDEHGKVWGFWVGINGDGLLPAKAHVDRGDYKKGKEPPQDLLSKFVSGEIDSGLTTPGGYPVDPPPSPCGPPVGVGKGRRGEDRTGEEPNFKNSISENNDGQESDMKIKNEIQAVCAGYGVKPGGFKNTWDDVKALGVGHSVGAVVRDFTSWLNENRGDDFPSGAVPKYLRVAHERLSADSQTSAEINDPEVASLARQITRASGGEIAFLDKQKVRLSAALKEFTLDEILAGFKEWFSKQDVAKDGPFLAGKYAQQAADLAYNVREDRLDREHAQAARDAKALQMQEEAEADRKKADAVRAEQESFDPLADLGIKFLNLRKFEKSETFPVVY